MEKTNKTPELVDPLRGYKPCPFCGGDDLTTTEWWDDDGEFEAVACKNCKAEAPATVWNDRAAPDNQGANNDNQHPYLSRL